MPAIVAPAVLAIVLRMRMAEVGLAMSFFMSMKRVASLRCFPTVRADSSVAMRVE